MADLARLVEKRPRPLPRPRRPILSGWEFPTFTLSAASFRSITCSQKEVTAWQDPGDVLPQTGRDSVGTRSFPRSDSPDSLGQFFLGDPRFRAPTSHSVTWLFLRRMRLLIGEPAIFLVRRSREQDAGNLLQEPRVHALCCGRCPCAEFVQYHLVRAPPEIGDEAGHRLVPSPSLRLLDGLLHGPPRFAVGLIRTSHRGFVHPPLTAKSCTGAERGCTPRGDERSPRTTSTSRQRGAGLRTASYTNRRSRACRASAGSLPHQTVN